jgi:hypothetical protein
MSPFVSKWWFCKCNNDTTYQLNQIYVSLNFVIYTNIGMSMSEINFSIMEEKIMKCKL